MPEPKTHFEQVSLDIVRRIVEEEIRQAEAADLAASTKGKLCQKQAPQKQD